MDTRTYADRREYILNAVKKRRKRLKKKSIQFLGGKCYRCGYNKCNDALDFHHKNPNEKDFGISSKGHTHAWEKLKSELVKCILLCANCHREFHAGLWHLEG